jgi:hypothetical protein
MKDLGLGEIGRRMNSKVGSVKQGEVLYVSRISMVLNWLNLNLSLAGLSWPLYIGGQVSRVRSGSIQIIVFTYDIFSYLIISMLRLSNGSQGYQDNGPY